MNTTPKVLEKPFPRALGTTLLLLGLIVILRKLCTRPQPPPHRYRFHPDYHELFTLRNRARVLIRPLRPEDRFRLAAEMKRLSVNSRYLRFHRAKSELTAEELRYLTHIDGVSHFALGAADIQGRGLATARFIRFADEPTVADMAIVVADRAQRQGLGRFLIQRLIAAAQERGIETLHCEILSTNAATLRLIHSIAPDAPRYREDNTIIIRIPTGTYRAESR